MAWDHSDFISFKDEDWRRGFGRSFIIGNIKKFVEMGILQKGWYVKKVHANGQQHGPYKTKESAIERAKEDIVKHYPKQCKDNPDFLEMASNNMVELIR